VLEDTGVLHYAHVGPESGAITSLARYRLFFNQAPELPDAAVPSEKPWAAFEFVHKLPGDLVFYQRGSSRLLYASLPLGAEEPSPVCLFGAHTAALTAARHNNSVLLSGSEDGALKLWRLSDAQLLDSLVEPYTCSISALEFVGPLLVRAPLPLPLPLPRPCCALHLSIAIAHHRHPPQPQPSVHHHRPALTPPHPWQAAVGTSFGSVSITDISTHRMMVVQRISCGDSQVTHLAASVAPARLAQVATAQGPRSADGGGVLLPPVGLAWQQQQQGDPQGDGAAVQGAPLAPAALLPGPRGRLPAAGRPERAAAPRRSAPCLPPCCR
jgi:hypothetical protein